MLKNIFITVATLSLTLIYSTTVRAWQYAGNIAPNTPSFRRKSDPDASDSANAPLNIKCLEITSHAATLSWNGDSSNFYQVRYRIKESGEWKTVEAGNHSFIKLNLLSPKTTYEFEVKSFNEKRESKWSSYQTFESKPPPGRPNMLIIYLDDARYDSFGATAGGLPFLPTPAIDRIAHEGVNFTYCFPAMSLCGPSRASIVSGLYPHHHGVHNNEYSDTLSEITAAIILHDAGYYTGFVGKYGFEKFPVPGYDYYCESSSDTYWDAKYDYNGQPNFIIPGHKTDVFTDKTLEFLNSVPPGEKFCLFLAHKAPHVPHDPRPQEDGIFDGVPMPVPSNFFPWNNNFPSHYYECNHGPSDTADFSDEIRGYFELVAGTEWSIDTILQYLDAHNLTDSTLILFTSDNGLLKSEHWVKGKELALDPSLRLPMFIRYPKWFPAGAKVDSEMVMNIDIAPTLLDAAGIPDTFHMDGVSMKSLYDQTVHRKELFYEYYYRGTCNPTFTAIRDFKYKYIQNACTSGTDEFYDLTLDSNENENLINAPNYFSLIDEYKAKLAALKVQYDYINLEDTTIDCFMHNVDSSEVINVGVPQVSTFKDGQLQIFPNPAQEKLNFYLDVVTDHAVMNIYNSTGQSFFEADEESRDGEVVREINISLFPAGYYFMVVRCNGMMASVPFVKY